MKLTLNSFIERANHIHHNKYDYSKITEKTLKYNIKICIICKIHGEFLQLTSSHLMGRGCISCGKKCRIDNSKKTKNHFINDANKVHNNRYDYSKINYINGKTKINIICSIHGEFYQTPESHLNGCGCKLCANDKISKLYKLNLFNFIKKSNILYNNKYDYSKFVYNNYYTKSKIICSKHGCFEQSPQVHLKGFGCGFCLKETKLKLNYSNFIQKANKIYHNKYDYSKTVYINATTKTNIICNIHGEFSQYPKLHLKGYGCRKCKNNNSKLFFIKANVVHHNKYDYSLSKYIKSNVKIKIICPYHGEFNQLPSEHIRGNGCKICYKQKELIRKNNNFIEKCNVIYNNKYDYSKVNYKGVKCKIIIICPSHGEFSQLPFNHIKGEGCKVCKSNKTKKSYSKFINEANIVHNNKYDYSKVNYDGAVNNIIITCKKHGDFLQTPHSHLNGSGCPQCNHFISKNETKWLDSLNIPKENRNKNIKIGNNKFNVDGIDYENKIVYEFNGDYWHGNPKYFQPNDVNPSLKMTYKEIYNKTMEKENKLKNAGYKVISIWESEFIKLIKNEK